MCRHWRVHGEYFALNSMYSSFEILSKFPSSKIIWNAFRRIRALLMLRWHTVVKTQRAQTGPINKTFLCFQTKGIHCYEKKSQTKVPTILTFEALARSRALATQDSPVSKERSQVLSALLSWCQIAKLRKKISLNLFKQVGCHDLDECSYYSNSASYCGSNNEGCINIGKNDLIIHKTKK